VPSVDGADIATAAAVAFASLSSSTDACVRASGLYGCESTRGTIADSMRATMGRLAPNALLLLDVDGGALRRPPDVPRCRLAGTSSGDIFEGVDGIAIKTRGAINSVHRRHHC
jgi:hypothetical protein